MKTIKTVCFDKNMLAPIPSFFTIFMVYLRLPFLLRSTELISGGNVCTLQLHSSIILCLENDKNLVRHHAHVHHGIHLLVRHRDLRLLLLDRADGGGGAEKHISVAMGTGINRVKLALAVPPGGAHGRVPGVLVCTSGAQKLHGDAPRLPRSTKISTRMRFTASWQA